MEHIITSSHHAQQTLFLAGALLRRRSASFALRAPLLAATSAASEAVPAPLGTTTTAGLSAMATDFTSLVLAAAAKGLASCGGVRRPEASADAVDENALMLASDADDMCLLVEVKADAALMAMGLYKIHKAWVSSLLRKL
jgi:hypothetical protein